MDIRVAGPSACEQIILVTNRRSYKNMACISLLRRQSVRRFINCCSFIGGSLNSTHLVSGYNRLFISSQTLPISSMLIQTLLHCLSDGSLGSLHRWRSQRIAKCWSCELQDTLALFWAAEHLTHWTFISLSRLSYVFSHCLQRAWLRVLYYIYTLNCVLYTCIIFHFLFVYILYINTTKWKIIQNSLT